MENNIIKPFLIILKKNYDIIGNKNKYEIRQYILTTNNNNNNKGNNNNNNNNNNDNKCFYCHKYEKNLKLRQTQSSTRITDEIISSQLVCDNCFIAPLLD